jgi:hypothetical protein
VNPLLIAAAVFGVLAVVGAVVFFVFFDKKVVDAKTAEKNLTSAVSEETGFTPTDLSCPSDVEAKVGVTFDCHFAGPDGPYTAHMKVTKVDGDHVGFDAKWALTGRG